MRLADRLRRPSIGCVEVLVQPLQKFIDVEPGANLLASLIAARMPISYSCMAGRCGTCRCRVEPAAALAARPAQHSDQGGGDPHVLACQTTLDQPCTVHLPEPDEVVVHPARIVKATVQAVQVLAHDVRRIVLKPAKPLAFSPGQYAQLQFTPEHVRPYSMAGLAGDAELEFHVRLVPGGRVSGYVANSLRPGDTVRVSGPLGTAYLRRRHTTGVLCVAGGTGLAPILSILRGALALGMPNPVHLYFGVRSPHHVYGLDRLADIQRRHAAFKWHTVVASGGDEREQRCGSVTEAIEQDLARLDGWRAYLCGSPRLVEAASVMVRSKGVEPAQIHADAFYPQPT